MNILFISLGCDKNLVDSEVMLGLLDKKGYKIVDEESEADVIVINTCCFINDAKEESVNTILEMAEYKKTGPLKALIVTGCLAQRYKQEIIDEIPEVDAILGTTSYEEIGNVLTRLFGEEKEKKEEQAKEPKEVKDSDYSSLIAGNLTKEELEYVLSYGPEEIPNGGFSMEDYMRILNTLCEPSERTGGPVQYYGSTPDYMPQYSVKDVNRLFESFSDFQFTEENDVEQGDYGDVNVDGEKIMFWAATENHVREATITSAEYNSEEMELYYTYSRGAYGDESYIAEKKAILKPNSEGLFKIVSIEEISREALDDSQPTQRKKETVKEDIPTGSYSYVAPVGGLRASMTIQSSGAVRMDTLMSGTGEQDSISYTIRKGSEAYGGVLYTLKGKSSADPVWEFVYYKDGDYFIEKANVEEGMTELKWIK